MWGLSLKKTIIWRVAFLKRCALSIWRQILACWIGKSIRYRQLLKSGSGSLIPSTSSSRRCPSARTTTTTVDMETLSQEFPSREMTNNSGEITSLCGGEDHDHGNDLVALKICLLGDPHIGKTSFLAKYIGKEKNQEDLEAKRINSMDKTLCIRGARISYSIWEVGGDAFFPDGDSSTSISSACKDSVV
nr:septum-promoting GTP-binding protein 1-like [Tanacetum cinerariifolium]